jgi:serpin B
MCRNRWVVLLLAGALLAACRPTVEIRAQVERQPALSLEATPVETLVQANTAFALDLYCTLAAKESGNLIFSPYSISLAFSLAYAGARSQTEAEMQDVLHFLEQDAHHPAINTLDQRLKDLGGAGQPEGVTGDPFQLHIANAAWGQQGYPFMEGYLEVLARYYGAGLRVVDFSADPEGSRQAINRWVEEQTSQRIQNLMQNGSITPDTRLVLANAIYFKASWLHMFNPERTREGNFTLLDGSTVRIPLMSQVERLQYTQGHGFQAAFLPYLGAPVEMLVILPTEGSFEEFEDSLDPTLLEAIAASDDAYLVSLTMPRFDFESALDLKELLAGMGLESPFGPQADFSGMGDGLFISHAIHKADIKVNEEGTEAAAATGIAVPVEAPPPATLTLNRPFLFAILDRESGALLFLGRVLDPSAGS